SSLSRRAASVAPSARGERRTRAASVLFRAEDRTIAGSKYPPVRGDDKRSRRTARDIATAERGRYSPPGLRDPKLRPPRGGSLRMGYMHGGKVVARALHNEGVPFVFTLCGGHVMSIYDGCLDEGIRVIDTRHEQTAGHAADGWARVTGKPGVAI